MSSCVSDLKYFACKTAKLEKVLFSCKNHVTPKEPAFRGEVYHGEPNKQQLGPQHSSASQTPHNWDWSAGFMCVLQQLLFKESFC